MTQQAQKTSTSLMIAGLDRVIEMTRDQARAAHAEQLHVKAKTRQRADAGTVPPHSLEELDLFLGRLRQVKEWLVQDPHLLQVVDEHMSRHVHNMEKRQQAYNIRLSVITTVMGALLGWLTSALASPISLWHLLLH